MTRKSVPLFGEDKATEMLAKALVLHAFRNPLEDLHAGTTPSSKTGDYTDVKVVTPYGEIPWTDVSRISDEEMKTLMMEVVSKLYTLLVGLDDKYMQASVCVLAHDDISKWAVPSIEEGLRQAVLHPSGFASQNTLNAIIGTIMQCEADRRSKAQAK